MLVRGSRLKPHFVVVVVNGEKKFVSGFSLVRSELSFKLLMRILRSPILHQLVLTTTSGFLVVNPSEKIFGFSDSLFYYDSFKLMMRVLRLFNLN